MIELELQDCYDPSPEGDIKVHTIAMDHMRNGHHPGDINRGSTAIIDGVVNSGLATHSSLQVYGLNLQFIWDNLWG